MTYVTEDRWETAPKPPLDRPPTRAETWAYYSHIYADDLENAAIRARNTWAWLYVYCFNFRGWRKQPDWKEGDPVIEAGIPNGPFFPGEANYASVKLLLDAARRAA